MFAYKPEVKRENEAVNKAIHLHVVMLKALHIDQVAHRRGAIAGPSLGHSLLQRKTYHKTETFPLTLIFCTYNALNLH